jgi:hypothetical protein
MVLTVYLELFDSDGCQSRELVKSCLATWGNYWTGKNIQDLQLGKSALSFNGTSLLEPTTKYITIGCFCAAWTISIIDWGPSHCIS